MGRYRTFSVNVRNGWKSRHPAQSAQRLPVAGSGSSPFGSALKEADVQRALSTAFNSICKLFSRDPDVSTRASLHGQLLYPCSIISAVRRRSQSVNA